MKKNRIHFRLVLSGVIGIVSGMAFAALDYAVCGRSGTGCPWKTLSDRIGFGFDVLLHRVGQSLGVRYGYVPYFPNRATQIFLATLAVGLPWLSWFLLGIVVYGVVHFICGRAPAQNRPTRTV
jgi:hypothetical protein